MNVKNSNRLAKNTMLLSIGVLLINLLQFLMVPLFSAWLSAEEYGTFDLFVTYVSMLLPIVNLASGEALFRFSIDVDKLEEKKIYISNGLAIVCIGMFVFTVAIAIALCITHRWILISFYFLLLGQVLNSYCQSFLRGIKKLNIYSFCSAITAIFIAIAVTVFVRMLNYGVHGIVLGYAVGYIVGDILILVSSKYYKYFSLSCIKLQEMKRMIEYSLPLIPNNLSWWVMNASDRWIISVFLGTASNGIYAIAYKIPSVCASVFGMFNISWQDSASEVVNAQDRDAYYNSVYKNSLRMLLTICCCVLSVNFILFDYIFDVKYHDGYMYTPILLTATVFSSIAQYYGGIMISFKEPKSNGYTTVIGAVVNVVIHVILINFIGLFAAAISTLISNMVVCVLRKRKLSKNVKFDFGKKVYLFWLVYAYFLAFVYIDVNYYFRWLNIVTAIILFIMFNKKMISLIIEKIGCVISNRWVSRA